ncbi:unnamed protein product [Linum tenue]|uniref:Bacterial Ig-like domain-containing protein n=1 Tax=Linum tenue TaxID=586396 RepID=A0AAV0QTF2_9ROSI|nr:unnamed protein product [Linum tenue]
MGSLNLSWVVCLLSILGYRALLCCDAADVSLKFLKAPHEFSQLSRATFEFLAFLGENESAACVNCSFSCKLDGGKPTDCGSRKVYYAGLQDGNHGFEVCSSNGSSSVVCADYNWTVDTISPSASIAASSSFTNSINVSVNITFTEPCTGGAGFRCASADSCDLLVYGAGQVMPSSFTVIEPNLKYSLMVTLSRSVVYGRVVLVMNKNFCTDNAGNMFTRTENSSYFLRFDRRSVFVDMRTRIPERLLQLQGETRTVQATNSYDNLKLYLYFPEPILNSSAEVLNSLNASGGSLLPLSGESLGNRRFGFEVVNVSAISIVTVAMHSDSIISRPGTPVTPIAPATFLYDTEKPAVRLSTTSNTRTREHNLLVSINFHELSRSSYITEVQADGDTVSVSVPGNITSDIAGNKNLPSNVLQVRHYSLPRISCIVSTFSTACFIATCLVAGLLTLSTASLQAIGAFSRPSPLLTSEPTRNLFRIACYIQIFALSRWMAVTLPVEYFEVSRGLRWSIPYFTLPWETGGIHSVTLLPNSSAVVPHSSTISTFHNPEFPEQMHMEKERLSMDASVYGLPLTPMEYKFFFESQDMKPEADFITETQRSNGWKDFNRSMFWLAVICGGLVLLHAIALLILKYKKREEESQKHNNNGALVFPRFEIFLLVLVLPCICKASAGLVKGKTVSGTIVGSLLLSAVGMLLLALLLFLSIGITLGKLLQYKEVHQVGQIFHWYQELVRVTLGPGKRGQWTWKDQPINSAQLTKLGPLFEDLRGPPKYMLSQIGVASSKYRDRIIASDDETEDAEAPFIQKLFGILRIYYTLLESIKRVALGFTAGSYANTWSSKTPSTVLLCITAFQLFFVVLKKPFIKKKVQLVEIVSLSCQVLTFTTCLILSKMEPLSTRNETRVGIFMVAMFLTGFLAHTANEWYALYRQTKNLDPAVKSFSAGLKMAAVGLLVFLGTKKMCSSLLSKLPKKDREAGGGETARTSSAERDKNSGSSGTPMVDKPWMRQLREMAKASFTREGSAGGRGVSVPTDPSSSRTKWSGLWGSKKSESSSQQSSADFKSRPNRLYKDLEAIFESK